MRGGGGIQQKVKEKGTTGLAWGSVIVGGVGGLAAAVSFIGDIIAWALGLFPDEVSSVLFWGGVIGLLVDILLDFIPNQVALWGAMLLPSVARAAQGEWAANFNTWCDGALDWVVAQIGGPLGITSTFFVAAAGLLFGFLMGRRVLAKSGGGGR